MDPATSSTCPQIRARSPEQFLKGLYITEVNTLILRIRRLEPREAKGLALGHTANSGYDLYHYDSLSILHEKHESGRVNFQRGENCPFQGI